MQKQAGTPRSRRSSTRYLFWLALALLLPSTIRAQDVFDGCPMQGTAKPARVKAINQLKNRYTAPTDAQIDRSITLAAILKPGNDTNRWKSSSGAELVGFVLDVVPGGQETCNCGKKDPAHRDAHIELVLHSTDTLQTQSVVVEVTPRFQAIMKKQGVDWTEPALRKKILHKWVKVRAWMMFDAEHANAAENTNPGAEGNWRATAWEGHPVSSIEVLPPQ